MAYTHTQSLKKAQLYLILFGFAFSFGCLTKGIAGITAIPGILAWLIYNGKLKSTLYNKGFYIALLSFLILVIGYYWLRGHLTPGYINAVLENEILGRLKRQDFLNQKSLPFYFYFECMITQDRFYTWILILPPSIFYILTQKASVTKNAGVFFTFIFFSVAILLAISRTKLEWYDAPLYPLMAIIIGLSVFMLINDTNNKKVMVLFAYIFCFPFYKIILNNDSVIKGTTLGNFITEIRGNSKHKKDHIYIINSDANFTVNFYCKKDCVDGNSSEIITQDSNLLGAGSYILTEKYAREVDVNNIFNLTLVHRNEQCAYYKIIGKK